MSDDNKSMNIHQYLVHLATNPALQGAVAELSGDDLHQFLTKSGLSEDDAGMLVKANSNHEGTKALVDNLNTRSQDWTFGTAAESQDWTFSAVAGAQDWTFGTAAKSE